MMKIIGQSQNLQNLDHIFYVQKDCKNIEWKTSQ